MEKTGYTPNRKYTNLTEALAECEALRTDAMRYRWLRDNHTLKTSWYDEENVEAIELEFRETGSSLDEAVDRDMRFAI